MTRRDEIFAIIKDYAELNRTLPNTNAIYTVLVKPVLDPPICRSTFATHFGKLIKERKIEIDPKTKAVSIVKSELTVLE